MASAKDRVIEIPHHEELEPALWWPECCIYKVPEKLWKGNPEAYTPQLISIGPLHHNRRKLKPMEKQKELYNRYFQTRLCNTHQEAFTKYKNFIESKENEIRRCYSKKCQHFSKQKFVEMILLDSVFIMELFLRNQIILDEKDHLNQTEQEKDLLNQIKNDLLFSKLWIQGDIIGDLLLLENQLPMFVLVELYNNAVPDFDKKMHVSFHKLACNYFETRNQSFHRDHISEKRLQMYEKSKHFVDLIRYRCLPYNQDYFKQGETNPGDLKTARKLNEAGITFEKIHHGPLLAVEFQKKKFLNMCPCLSTIPRMNIFKSRLRIPQLIVDDGTENLLRNLVALEQCHYPDEAYVCNYVVLMDYLIDTKEDVDFLVEMQVIVKKVGSNKEVANMFNSLCKEVHISSSGYEEIIEKLNGHYAMPWNHNMAKLKSVYFCDLWRGSATVVGIAVFLFSLIDIVQSLMGQK
ncbi:hypothetical protein L6164_003578 [Bauhinia variegata]|uniref:Uncharacterized protein n=1 Tax=Bauhinia variegata TaxID=167791 RepID=A0ACB9Q146_BAUVA|nr:hypothetical protein L6164_003578 [Bauhinia variegata]